MSGNLKKLEDEEKRYEREIKQIENEINTIMENKDEMQYAYLTENDVRVLMNYNKIKTPFVLIEAFENTKVDYYIPKSKDNPSSNITNLKENSENDYQIVLQSNKELNLYIASDKD